MKKSVMLSAILVICAGSFAQTEQFITVKARAWFNDIGGDFRGSTSTSSGSSVDFKDDLDIAKTSDTFTKELVASLNLPILPRINAGYWQGNFDKTTTLTSSFTFAGTTYNVNENVDARIETQSFWANVEFSFPFLKSLSAGLFDLGFQVGFDHYDADFDIQSNTTGVEQARTLKGPIPVIGAVFRINVFDFLGIEANLRGLSTNWVGNAYTAQAEGSYFNGNIEANVKLFGPLLVGLGFHIVTLDAVANQNQSNEIAAAMNLHGFYVTAGFSF